MNKQRSIALALLLAGLSLLPAFTKASAAGAASMVLACENGAHYPIRPLAVSREGDLVTGYLLRTRSGHAVHLRLVPMGTGYRYEGPGVWFDGVRGHATLNWGRANAVPCEVLQEP